MGEYIPAPPVSQDSQATRWYIEVWKKLGRAGAILGNLKFGSTSSYTEIEADGNIIAPSATITELDTSIHRTDITVAEYLSCDELTTNLINTDEITTGALTAGAVTTDDITTGALVASEARIGTDTDYTQFEPDGTMVAYGDATTWDDVYPSSVTVGVGGTAPAFSAYAGGNLKAYEFTGTTSNKELQIGYQIYHSWEEGTPIVPHLHVHINNNGTGGTVIFDMIYHWSNRGATGTVTETTVQNIAYSLPANSTVYQNEIISFGNIAGPDKTISSCFMTQIKRRQDLDTFTGSVWLLSADIHIEKNTIGSRDPLSK